MQGSNLTGKEWHAIKRAKKWAQFWQVVGNVALCFAMLALGWAVTVGALIIAGAKF